MIRSEVREGVKWIFLSKPERKNALDIEGVRQLYRELRSSVKEDVFCVVVTGEGDFFCAGLDLSQPPEPKKDFVEELEAHVDDFFSLIKALVENPKVTVARINGPAVGFGAELTYWFDIKIAVENAYFWELFPSRGLVPDGGGPVILSRIVGITRAFKILAFPEKIPARELAEAGLLTEVCPPEKLDDVVNEYIEKIRKAPKGVLSKTKMLLWDTVKDELSRYFAKARVIQTNQVQSQEFAEGVSAFFAKREPDFSSIKIKFLPEK